MVAQVSVDKLGAVRVGTTKSNRLGIGERTWQRVEFAAAAIVILRVLVGFWWLISHGWFGGANW